MKVRVVMKFELFKQIFGNNLCVFKSKCFHLFTQMNCKLCAISLEYLDKGKNMLCVAQDCCPDQEMFFKSDIVYLKYHK